MGGVSINRERMAEGLTEGRDATRSGRVSISFAGEISLSLGCEASHRLMAMVPASRTTALRSAPTYP